MIKQLLLLGAFSATASVLAEPGELARFDSTDLTPDGERLLLLEASGESYDLTVFDVATEARQVIHKSDGESGLFNWCRWANNDRVLCSMRYYRGGGRVGKVTYTRLVAMDHDGGNFTRLVPRAKNYDRRPPVWNAQVQDRVIAWLPDEPENVLIQLNREHPNRPSVYRLNIYDNSMSRVLKPRSKVRRWYATFDGEPTLAIGYRNEQDPVLYHVRGRRLSPYKNPAFASEIPPAPLGFSADKQFAYLNMTNAGDRHGVYQVRLADGATVRTIYEDAKYDVFGRLVLHPETGLPVGVEYVRHHPQRVWFDDGLEALYAHIDQRLPGDHFDVLATDYAYKRFAIMAYGGIVPRLFLYDRTQDSATLIGAQYDTFKDEEIADLEPVSYPSRDGLTIPGYLAVPNATRSTAAGGTPDSQQAVPVIVIPHGGPYARDTAEFDYWTQFFISNGYAVLKPNYRGSVGYGEFFLQAGYRQWGLKMQEDIVDGIQWLVEKGVADPERVCVVGASYGGFSALVSAFKSSEHIQCAVSLAGITDLERMVARIYHFDLVKRNRSRIQSSKQLRANSPYHQAAQVDVPVLLVHGGLDTVVRVRQSRQMARALEANGKPYRYIEQPQGDHFLSVRSQRREFFQAVDQFLAEHLN